MHSLKSNISTDMSLQKGLNNAKTCVVKVHNYESFASKNFADKSRPCIIKFTYDKSGAASEVQISASAPRRPRAS